MCHPTLKFSRRGLVYPDHDKKLIGLMRIKCLLLFPVLFALASVADLPAQSSALKYQGRLNDGAGPANGFYDLRVALFSFDTAVVPVAGPLTNLAAVVSNGLFTVTLDFGSQPFDGSERWVEVAVRTNRGGEFVVMSPRQKIHSLPYAIRAANFGGNIADDQLSTNVARLNASQTFSGAVTFKSQANNFSGSFTGDAAGLTNAPLAEPALPLLTRPAMGIANWLDYWDSGLWNEPGEDIATNAILKMAANGLVAGGRDWLRLDYGWVGGRVNGALVVNSNKFPHGMPWLIQFAHSHNVKVDLALTWGLESSMAELPGDIRTLMSWGVDGICVLTDIGHWPLRPTFTELRQIMRIAHQAMLDANGSWPIGSTIKRGVPLTFSVNQEPEWRVPSEAAIVANSLYVQPGPIHYAAHDIANWARHYFMPFAWFNRPGHYTHANALRANEVGHNPNTFRLWSQVLCMMAAGFWTTTITANDPAYLKYMTNQELNSLWLDSAGIVGRVASSNNFREVWVRPLGSPTSRSNLVLLLNTATNGNANLTVTAAQLGVSPSTVMRVRDPLAMTNVATFSGAWTYPLSQTNVALFHVFPDPTAALVIGDGRGLTNLPNSIVASGTVTLLHGTNRVVTGSANVTNRFTLAYRSLNGTLSTIGIRNIEANTAFTIFSTSSTDTNQVDWGIIKP